MDMPTQLVLPRLWIIGMLFFSTVGVTVAINPFTAFDPINLIKMLFLTSASFGLIPYLLSSIRTLQKFGTIFLTAGIIMISGMFLAALASPTSITQQVWGVWGRSTGILTYFSLLVLMYTTAVFVIQVGNANYLLDWFQKTSYFITFYVLIQYADLDPINWSQKLPFATLGNINFMSSFLGLATCLMISRTAFIKMSFTTKTFFLLISLLNSVLIIETESIQGIGIIMVGVIVIGFIRTWNKLGKVIAGLYVVSLSLFGSFIFLGFAGIGPLGKRLVQDTVLYRLDYWGAGLRMFIDNPIFGVGADSYGDYYREYRDLIAVERTGPGRISNTAHNVFLDILSGSGAVAGLSFITIFLGISFLTLRLALRSKEKIEVKLLSPLILSSSVFLLVSINQIGVAVWIFLFLGVALGVLVLNNQTPLIGIANSKRIPKSSQLSSIGWSRNLSKNSLPIFLASIFLACVGFFLSLQPNATDTRFLSAFREDNVGKMLKITDQIGATRFHDEKILEILVNREKDKSTLEVARKIFEKYPRSFYAAQAIYFNPYTSTEDRLKFAKILKYLEPNDRLVLEGWLDSSDSFIQAPKL